MNVALKLLSRQTSNPQMAACCCTHPNDARTIRVSAVSDCRVSGGRRVSDEECLMKFDEGYLVMVFEEYQFDRIRRGI